MAHWSERSIDSGKKLVLRWQLQIDLCYFAGEDYDIYSKHVLLKMGRVLHFVFPVDSDQDYSDKQAERGTISFFRTEFRLL